MEIPAMRIPNPLHIIRKTYFRTYSFMKEAVPVFIFASCIVFLFDRLGGLSAVENVLRPLTNGFLGLPEKSVQVFIKTMIRRESGATELMHLSGIYNHLQLVVNLFIMLNLTPCVNSIVVIIKERGLKAAIAIIGTVLVYAIASGGALNHLCLFLGITFS
jgi:ferrous iron transport protein B